MRKGLCFWLGIILIVTPALYAVKIIDVYRKGEIKLLPDPEFGKNTDWDELLYAGINGITFCPDGSFFVAARKQHKIFKFDKAGNFLFGFGQKGAGPGDLNHPGELSILDNKYLVVGESPMNRRISIFDLDGKFVKLVKINFPAFDVVALKENKIAIRTQSFRDISMLKNVGTIKVYIKDIATKKEKEIVSEPDQVMMGKQGNNMFYLPAAYKVISIHRSKAGNLLVGNNYKNTIIEYSPGGVRIASFELNKKPVTVTQEIIAKHKRDFLATAAKRRWNNSRQLKAFKAFDSYRIFFKKHLPFHNSIMIDSQGNALVFHYTGCLDTVEPGFQVYTPGGKYICDSKFVFGEYRFPFVDSKFFRKTAIRNGHFYILSEQENEDGNDTYKKMLKVKL